MSDSHLLREVFRGENGLRSRLPKGQNGGQGFEKSLKRELANAVPRGPQATSSNDGAQGRGAEKVSRSEGDRAAPEPARRLDGSKAGGGKQEVNGEGGAGDNLELRGSSNAIPTLGRPQPGVNGAPVDFAAEAKLAIHFSLYKAKKEKRDEDGNFWPKCYWPGIKRGFRARPEEALSRERLARRCTQEFAKDGVEAGNGDRLIFSFIDCNGVDHEFRPGHDEKWQEMAPHTPRIYVRPMRADEKPH